MSISNTTLLAAAGGGLLYWGGVKTLVRPNASPAKTAAALGGVGVLLLAAHRAKSTLGLALGGIAVGAVIVTRLQGPRRAKAVVGAAAHPGLGPSLAIQEAAWRGQPNAQKMYPWELIFSQPTVASGEYPGFMVGADAGPDAYGTYGGDSGGNPTRTSTSTEVRSPTSTSTEVRSPTSTSTEVRSPTSTSTEAFTADNFTATVTGGAGAGATTSVNIYFTPPNHMADDRAHTSHIGVVPLQQEQEDPQQAFGGYPPYPYLPR